MWWRFSLRPALLILFVMLAGCSSFMTGPERLARFEQLLVAEEYGKAEALLAKIDARDSEFEALVVRRRAIRPLIAQFEESTLQQVEALKKSDDWPGAETLIKDARNKLPRSAMLQRLEEQFYADRHAKLEQLDREMELLRAEYLRAKTPLIQETAQVHPTAISNRWQSFKHHRETEALAGQLLSCGNQALEQRQFELAESCLTMAAELTDDEVIATRLAELQESRQEQERQTAARAKARQEAELAAKQAHTVEQLADLKFRYRYLVDAGWLAAGREVLAELQNRAPDDPDIVAWAPELEALIAERVAQQIEEGQTLYSTGRLHGALAVWRAAEKLAPDDAVLQAHIARVERFIAKLERLDNDDV